MAEFHRKNHINYADRVHDSIFASKKKDVPVTGDETTPVTQNEKLAQEITFEQEKADVKKRKKREFPGESAEMLQKTCSVDPRIAKERHLR